MRKARFAASLAAVSLLLAGCNGLDDLRVTNHFPSAIELRKGSARGEKWAMIAPGATETWNGAGGYKGSAADNIYCIDSQGKSLGLLSKAGHDIQRESNGSLNGSGVLVVTLGP